MLWQSLVSSYNASQKDSHRTFGMCPLTFKICLKCVLSKGFLCMDQGVAVHSLWPSLKWMSNCCGPCWLRDSKYCMLLPQNGISKKTWGSMWLTCWTLRKFIWILMQTQWTKGLHTSFQNDYKRLTKLWTVKVIEMILTPIFTLLSSEVNHRAKVNHSTLLDKDKVTFLKHRVNLTAGKTKCLILGQWMWNRLTISITFVSLC